VNGNVHHRSSHTMMMMMMMMVIVMFSLVLLTLMVEQQLQYATCSSYSERFCFEGSGIIIGKKSNHSLSVSACVCETYKSSSEYCNCVIVAG